MKFHKRIKLKNSNQIENWTITNKPPAMNRSDQCDQWKEVYWNKSVRTPFSQSLKLFLQNLNPQESIRRQIEWKRFIAVTHSTSFILFKLILPIYTFQHITLTINIKKSWMKNWNEQEKLTTPTFYVLRHVRVYMFAFWIQCLFLYKMTPTFWITWFAIFT